MEASATTVDFVVMDRGPRRVPMQVAWRRMARVSFATAVGNVFRGVGMRLPRLRVWMEREAMIFSRIMRPIIS